MMPRTYRAEWMCAFESRPAPFTISLATATISASVSPAARSRRRTRARRVSGTGQPTAGRSTDSAVTSKPLGARPDAIQSGDRTA